MNLWTILSGNRILKLRFKVSLIDSMYKVFDSLGNLMRKFSTYQAAATYKLAYGNYGWTIK